MDDRTPAFPALPGSGRLLRAVRDDAPWPGALVGEDDGVTRLHVPVAHVGADESVGEAADSGHLLVPVDLAAGPDGVEAVYPFCGERLMTLLHRRADAGAPLRPGECVTVAVSVLRGCAAGARSGEWWVTDDGRPVLAAGAGTRAAVDASAEVLGQLSVHAPALAPALQDARVALGDNAAVVLAEDELFRAAEPEAVQLDVLVPRPARSLSVAPQPGPASVRPTVLRDVLHRHVDAALGDAVADAFDHARELWWRMPPAARRARRDARVGHGRRGALVAAGVVAVTVLCIGLLWPKGDDGARSPIDDATTGAPAGAPIASPAATPDAGAPAAASAAPSPASGAPDDPVALADVLLGSLAACGGDAACAASYVEGPARLPLGGAAALPASGRTLTLVDDYGGVAAVRVAPTEQDVADAVVVIVEADGKWLIRDVYDVADQP